MFLVIMATPVLIELRLWCNRLTQVLSLGIPLGLGSKNVPLLIEL